MALEDIREPSHYFGRGDTSTLESFSTDRGHWYPASDILTFRATTITLGDGQRQALDLRVASMR
jgi:hypothetical protein